MLVLPEGNAIEQQKRTWQVNSLIYAIHQLNLLERPRQLVSTCRFVKSAGPFCKGKILSLFKGNQTKGNKVFIYIYIILYIYYAFIYMVYLVII